MAKNNVAKRSESALALPHDYGEDVGSGLNLDMDDLLIPFMKLLQTDSKECDPDEEKHVPGAKQGLYLNVATGELFEEVILVPAVKKKSFVEWLPERAGFVAEHPAASPIVLTALQTGDKRDLKSPTGNTLQETFSLYCIQCDKDLNPVGVVVVPFVSSKMKVWRGYWNGVNMVKGLAKQTPVFAHSIRMGVFGDKGGGKKFKNMTMVPANGGVLDSLIAPDSPAYIAAKKLAGAVNKGTARADFNTAGNGTEDSGENPF